MENTGMAELKGGRGFSSSVGEVWFVQWITQGQAHSITVLVFKLFEWKLFLEAEGVLTDSENNFQFKKLNQVHLLIVNTWEYTGNVNALLHCPPPIFLPGPCIVHTDSLCALHTLL